MTDQNGAETTGLNIRVMADGNIDMDHLSRAILAAVEFYRTGYE